jgi:hypothetical protein
MRVIVQKPLKPRQMFRGRMLLERAYAHLRGLGDPESDAACRLVLRLVWQLDVELLDHEKTRLREKGYRFP